jgi:photosystem II stability/assembly factor-like uncharacterized protein
MPMKKLLYFFLSILAAPSYAQQQPYVSSGPQGGQARMFENQSGRVLVAARGGAYERTGAQWQPITPNWGNLGCTMFNCLNSNGLELLAGTTSDGIFYSNDNGGSWTNVSGNLRIGSAYRSVLLAGPNYMTIRADSSYLYTTPDQGGSWIQKNFAIGNGRAFYLSSRNNIVYVTTSNGLYVSMDNGQSFMVQNPAPGLDGKMLWKNDTLWIAGSNGLQMSANEGRNFLTPRLSGRKVGSVAVEGRNIIASVSGSSGVDSVLYSADAGLSFSNILPNTSLRFNTVYDLASDNSYFLVGTEQGVLYANTNNSGWRRDDSGFHARRIHNLGSGAQGSVYAMATDDGAFRTTDSGAHWSASGSTLNGAENTGNAVDGYNQFVYIAGASDFYRSADGGASFTRGATGLSSGSYSSVYVLKTTGQVMLVRSGELYTSTDNGLSFAKLNTGIPAAQARSIYHTDTSWFVATYNDSLYQAGSSLQFHKADNVWGSIEGVSHNGNVYYAATRAQGLFSSTDGRSWSKVASATVPIKLNAIATLDTTVYLGTDDGLMSNTGGSWVADSLAGRPVYALVVNNRKLYAGTCDGVWARKNLPTPPPDTTLGVRSLNSLGTLQVYPNPAGGDFKASFQTAEAGTATLSLADLAGRIVFVKTTAVQAGRNEITIPAGSLQLAGGIYFFKVQTQTRQGIQRILIQSK